MNCLRNIQDDNNELKKNVAALRELLSEIKYELKIGNFDDSDLDKLKYSCEEAVRQIKNSLFKQQRITIDAVEDFLKKE